MFSKALLLGAVATLAAAQSQVLTFTRVPNPVTDGQPQAITYATNDTTTPVEIILRQGPSSNLKTVSILTKDATGGQFIWTPPKSLPNGADYALEITQGNQVNYFGPLTVQGAIAASVSAAASSTSANMTMTTTRGTAASMGTGTTMHRNTTMVHPTMTHKKTTTTKKATKTGMSTTSNGASFQATSKTATATSSPTGGASPDFTAHSSFALVFGALAAILYLH